MEPLHNGNLPVSNYKGTNFDVTIDGNYIYVGLYGLRTSLPVSQNIDFFGKMKKEEINKLKITMISGNLPPEEASKFLKKYNKEFKKDYAETMKVWKSINK